MLGHRMMMAAMVKSSAPVNTVAPAVTGSASVGSVLSCTTGTWTGTPTPTYTYQWQHGTTNISGQTASTYTAESAYAGETIRCVVTATNSVSAVAANSNSTSALTWGPINTVAPAVTGSASVGSVLSCTTGTWTGYPTPTYTYQWQHGTTNISGQTASTYTAESAYAGETIRCVVTATNSVGNASANSNATAALVWLPINTVAPAVTGTTPTVGDTLSCTTGTWTGYPTPTYTYQWQHGTTNITGKTSSTYVTEAAYVGETIRCVVTGSNSQANVNANSNATSALLGAGATGNMDGLKIYYKHNHSDPVRGQTAWSTDDSGWTNIGGGIGDWSSSEESEKSIAFTAPGSHKRYWRITFTDPNDGNIGNQSDQIREVTWREGGVYDTTKTSVSAITTGGVGGTLTNVYDNNTSTGTDSVQEGCWLKFDFGA